MKKKILLTAAFLCAAWLSSGAELPKLPFTIEPRLPRQIDVGKKTVITLTPENFDIVAGKTPTA